MIPVWCGSAPDARCHSNRSAKARTISLPRHSVEYGAELDSDALDDRAGPPRQLPILLVLPGLFVGRLESGEALEFELDDDNIHILNPRVDTISSLVLRGPHSFLEGDPLRLRFLQFRPFARTDPLELPHKNGH
jgi:hypothetical protein